MKRIILQIVLTLSVVAFSVGLSFAQPSDAQIKKDISGAKTVSVTLVGNGTKEWSSTYKKYVWTRHFSAKVKTDKAGEFIIVKGYASYDIVGGRYAFWRTFTTSNSYAGKPNPTISEINEILQKSDIIFFDNMRSIIGEFEMFRLVDEPNWEWHSPNSVSFTALSVFNVIYRGGSYQGEPQGTMVAGQTIVDKVEAIWRIRLYRTDEKSPWNNARPQRYGLNKKIPNGAGEMIFPEKLLERKTYRSAEVDRMPRLSKPPQLTK